GVRERGRAGAGEAAAHSARGRERALRERAREGGEGERARRRGSAGAAGQAALAGARAGDDRLRAPGGSQGAARKWMFSIETQLFPQFQSWTSPVARMTSSTGWYALPV